MECGGRRIFTGILFLFRLGGEWMGLYGSLAGKEKRERVDGGEESRGIGLDCGEWSGAVVQWCSGTVVQWWNGGMVWRLHPRD